MFGVSWKLLAYVTSAGLAVGAVPMNWTRAVTVPIYKGKGVQNDCKSYRAISLLSVASKVYSRMLIDRVNAKTDAV